MLPKEIRSRKGEQWREILGGGYWVSSHGRVASRSYNHGVRFLKQERTRGGYLRVTLSWRGTLVRKLVHHLVLEQFEGCRPYGLDCCHRDGNPANNRLGNLRWDTRRANEADKVRHGTRARGERHGKSKLTEKMVRKIRKLYRAGKGNFGYKKVAAIVGCHFATVAQVVKGKTWAWLT